MGTTNREIAEDVGITTGAIYHYFESKQDLYLAVFEEVDRLILERYQQVSSDEQPFIERIVGVLQESTAMNQEDETLASFIAMAAFEAHRNPELRPSYRAHQKRLDQYFDRVVNKAVASGELPAAERRTTTDLLQVLIHGLVWLSVDLQDPQSHRKATKAVIAFLRGEVSAVKAAQTGGPRGPNGATKARRR